MADRSWKVIKSQQVVDNPYTQVFMQSLELPDGRLIEDWPIIQTLDYVNALVLNDAGEAMILEGYKHRLGRSSWQVVGGYLEQDEQPVAAIQRELLEETGYTSEDWDHLGSFIVDANRRVGEGHFFLARNAKKVTEPNHNDLEYFDLRWVSLESLKVALRDGRVGILSYAINISLALNLLQL
jgi:ADP-ribose pyrophosphatase